MQFLETEFCGFFCLRSRKTSKPFSRPKSHGLGNGRLSDAAKNNKSDDDDNVHVRFAVSRLANFGRAVCRLAGSKEIIMNNERNKEREQESRAENKAALSK